MKSDDVPMWDDPSESQQVRELLQAGRRAGGEVDYDSARGLAQHLAHIQAGTPLPHWAQAGGAGMSAGALVAWISVPVVTASVVAAVWFSQKQPEAKPPSTGAVASAASTSTSAPVAAVNSAAAAVPNPPAALADEPVQRAGVLAGSDETPTSAAPTGGKPTRSDAPGASVSAAASSKAVAKTPAASVASNHPAVAPSPAARVIVKEPAPVAAAAQVEQPVEQPAAAGSGKPADQRRDDSRLEREMQMLAVAQRVLHDDPERALRLARQGEQEFSHSMFSAERQQVALLALVKLGRLDEARQMGQPFLAKYPNAPWSQRLRNALQTGRIE